MEPAISVRNLAKHYSIGAAAGPYRTLRESLNDSAAALWRGSARALSRLSGGSPSANGTASRRSLWALTDVSFDVHPGEIVGIVGRNGAGKSTLLKILSRVTEPTDGRVCFRGTMGSLLEVGVGFHNELTGRENTFLNGAILGMTRRQITDRYDAIVEFSGIGDLIDTPVKRYSSGMYVRLAFSVAAHLDPHILLIDEVLTVGDLAFQRKCMEYIRQLGERKATVLLVSHNMFAVKALCTRVIYLSEGKVCFDGAPEVAIHEYEKESRLATPAWAQKYMGGEAAQLGLRVTGIELLDERGEAATVYEHGERMRVRVHYHTPQPILDAAFCVGLVRSDNVFTSIYNTAMDGFPVPTLAGSGAIEILTPALKLVSELYAIQVMVWDTKFQKLYCAHEGSSFHVRHPHLSTHFGVFYEKGQWSWPDAVPGELTAVAG